MPPAGRIYRRSRALLNCFHDLRFANSAVNTRPESCWKYCEILSTAPELRKFSAHEKQFEFTRKTTSDKRRYTVPSRSSNRPSLPRRISAKTRECTGEQISGNRSGTTLSKDTFVLWEISSRCSTTNFVCPLSFRYTKSRAVWIHGK